MNNKRFMVSGKRLGSDEIITGWLVNTGHNKIEDKQGRYLRTEYCYQIQPSDYSHRSCIDPETIEPVAVHMIIADGFYFCPNCKQDFSNDPSYKWNYCPECGQRLDWGDYQMSREDFEGLAELAKKNYQERIAKTPDRIEYAIRQFEMNNIEYHLKNESSGHFHCRRKSDDMLFQFWAGTGKILGQEDERGIHALVKLLNS